MNRLASTAALVAGFGWCVAQAVAPSAAQTLDCFDAEGPVAQLICGDAELREFDGVMGDAFRELIRSTSRSERPEVLRAQRDWIAVRNDCLGAPNVPECLRVTIERRITDLSQGISEVVGTGPVASPEPEIDSRPLAELPGTAPVVRPLPPLSDARPADPPGPLPPRAGAGVPVAGAPQGAAPPALAPVAGTAPDPPPLGDEDARRVAGYLSSSVWRAEIASGIRPGTIYLFFANGSLVTADCVAAYDIGNWRVEGAQIRLEDGREKQSTAEILEADQHFIRMRVTERGTAKELMLVLRPVRGPFACTGAG